MESLIFRAFSNLSKLIGILVIAGIFTSLLKDVQRLAFGSKQRGLVSMSNVNRQLVGDTHWLRPKKAERVVQKSQGH